MNRSRFAQDKHHIKTFLQEGRIWCINKRGMNSDYSRKYHTHQTIKLSSHVGAYWVVRHIGSESTITEIDLLNYYTPLAYHE